MGVFKTIYYLNFINVALSTVKRRTNMNVDNNLEFTVPFNSTFAHAQIKINISNVA